MPENLLRDKGIIVTRPQHQADGLCHLLSAAGAVPIRYPTLAIEAPHDDTAARRIIDRLQEFDLAVFISANAVQQALELIPNGLPERLKLAVVGKASAAALARFAYSADLMPVADFTSEGLLALPRLQDVKGKRIVIFRGEGGRGKLAEVLSARGGQVVYAEVYRRVIPEHNPDELIRLWQDGKVHAATATSNETLQNLFDSIGAKGQPWLRNTPLVVFSARAKKLARELGIHQRVIVTEAPDDEAMIAALAQVLS